MKLITRALTTALRLELRAIPKIVSPFSAAYSSTLELLDREVWHLCQRDVDPVLMIDIEERMLRLDGSLRADARPASDDVALAVDAPSGSLIFRGGRYTKWQDNVRAIALGMEALRKVERYGITPNAEQYTGFKALGAGTPMPAAAPMSETDAAMFLARHSGWSMSELNPPHPNGAVAAAYRIAAKKLHPDSGGDPELFKRLGEARQVLESVQ